jgi:hypothetical protein
MAAWCTIKHRNNFSVGNDVFVSIARIRKLIYTLGSTSTNITHLSLPSQPPVFWDIIVITTTTNKSSNLEEPGGRICALSAKPKIPSLHRMPFTSPMNRRNMSVGGTLCSLEKSKKRISATEPRNFQAESFLRKRIASWHSAQRYVPETTWTWLISSQRWSRY